MYTSPLEDDTPTPDTILTSPPEAVGSEVIPAEINATEPAPLSVPPTIMLIDPPLPPLADPVKARMPPDFPLEAAPVESNRGPEDPLDPAFCDRNVKLPLLLKEDSPLTRSTDPPVAIADEAPARTTTWPPPRGPEPVPTITLTVPPAPPTAFPVANNATPLPESVVKPVLRRTPPLLPKLTAFADRTTTAPVELSLLPESTSILPLSAVLSMVFPATKLSLPPDPTPANPTTTLTAPPCPPCALPVPIVISPVFPSTVVPLLSNMEPETPKAPAFPDLM